jgi:hypothetical protein
MIFDFLKSHHVHESYRKYYFEQKFYSLNYRYKLISDELKPEFAKQIVNVIHDEDIQFLRKERHISSEVLYFYYQIIGDRYILFKSIKKYIQQFPERYIIRPIVRFIKKTIRKWTSKNVASR